MRCDFERCDACARAREARVVGFIEIVAIPRRRVHRVAGDWRDAMTGVMRYVPGRGGGGIFSRTGGRAAGARARRERIDRARSD